MTKGNREANFAKKFCKTFCTGACMLMKGQKSIFNWFSSFGVNWIKTHTMKINFKRDLEEKYF